MNAYSEDLREKIVEALWRGKTKSEAARSFGVSRSSVKRYAKLAEEGRPLAPKRRPGSKPKMGETARKLLEGHLQERPAATVAERSEYLGRVAGVRVSESTVSRMLRRLDFSRKKVAGKGVGPSSCLAVEGATRREVFEAYLEHVLAPTLSAGQIAWWWTTSHPTREAG